jgi:hypothetical protein
MRKLTTLWVWTPLLLVNCGGGDPTVGVPSGEKPSPGPSAAGPSKPSGKGKLGAQYGDFQASCRNINTGYQLGPYGDDVELTAECADGRGGWVWNTIHLDWLVSNQNGYLTWGSGNSYGDFQDTCGYCRACFVQTVLGIPICETITSNYGPSNEELLYSCGTDCNSTPGHGCESENGTWQTFCQNSGVSLSACLANYDGNLTYLCG